MGNISSANFKKGKDWQVFHNADERPSYAIGGQLEVNRNGLDALNLKKQIIQDAKNAYERNRKPKSPNFRATSYEWSLVVNLKESSTMQDLETLSKHFSDKYGFQCYQIAIHRDEGHINEQGEKIINHHAHLEFITLDKETGRNRFRGDFVTPKNFRIVQDEVAQILQMERGIDKRLSGAKRIEPRVFAAIKEQQKREAKALKNEFLSQKEVDARIKAEKEANTGQGLKKEFFWELSALKQQHYAEKQELEKKIQELKQKHAKEMQEKQKELESKNQEITQLRQENQQMQNVLNAEKEKNKKLEQKNKNLKIFWEITIQRFVSNFIRQSDLTERIKNDLYEKSKYLELDKFVARIFNIQIQNPQVNTPAPQQEQKQKATQNQQTPAPQPTQQQTQQQSNTQNPPQQIQTKAPQTTIINKSRRR